MPSRQIILLIYLTSTILMKADYLDWFVSDLSIPLIWLDLFFAAISRFRIANYFMPVSCFSVIHIKHEKQRTNHQKPEHLNMCSTHTSLNSKKPCAMSTGRCIFVALPVPTDSIVISSTGKWAHKSEHASHLCFSQSSLQTESTQDYRKILKSPVTGWEI